MKDICEQQQLTIIQKIDSGWSSDEKHLVKDQEDKRYVLRTNNITCKERFVREFAYIKKLYSLGVKTHQPYKIGGSDVDNKVYQLLEYIKGEQAETILPRLKTDVQYQIGVKVGQQLRLMHDVMPVSGHDWETEFNEKIDQYIDKYQKCTMQDQMVDEFIDFVNQHRYLLKGRTVCQNHGDFHVGNLIVDEKNNPYVIDFNRMKIADPWYEFNRIYFSFRVSPAFAKGQIQGYFNNKVPEEFFLYMKFYLLSTMIATLPWSISFGESDILFAKKAIKNVFDTYEGLTFVIPKWYQLDK